jgi:hypothetical protein
MKTYHWNGEFWYVRNWSILHWLRNWIIWIGGWEKPNGTGWDFFYDVCGKRKLSSPTPIALFGHRLVIFGWGWNMRIGHRWLVWTKDEVYVSPDGTPSQAILWLRGVPQDVVAAANYSLNLTHSSFSESGNNTVGQAEDGGI